MNLVLSQITTKSLRYLVSILASETKSLRYLSGYNHILADFIGAYWIIQGF